ncbi:flagellar basal-body MS-ring/collar protein FliF [Ruicaihuangia caeni]|uniref:flagellar basal-body MS-ring/collar protein FliF n=1 Tax=Ruicaihuangia caeni TaxID=3042517 RepID=UPI00338DB753
MPQAVTSLFQRARAVVAGFSIAQRTIALIGIAVLALGIVALGSWLLRPAYSPLFTGLSAADASAIVEQLRAENVPYELQAGGSTILVPEAHVYDQRLKAAAAGMPSAGASGYSLLDQMGVTASEFQQSVTYKRALEGELAATIGAMQGVRTASVRLAIPEETVFVAQKADPTASVFIETSQGTTLSNEQVQAIAHLTSAAVEGMPVENVAIIDADGTVLSAVGTGTAGTADQRAGDYESRVRTAVQAMLDRVVGTGNATVVVAAELSLSTGERLEETYTNPEGAPAINESTTTEQYTGNGDTAAGVLGPDNIAVPGNAQGGAYNSETSTRNNALNRVTESTVRPAGELVRQSVSVAVDSAAAEGIGAADLRALVASAAGIDTDRGDSVTVEVVPFSQAAAQQAAAELEAARDAAFQEQLWRIATIVMIALAILLPLLLAVVMMKRRGRGRHVAVPAAIEAPPTAPLDYQEVVPPPVDDEPELPEVISAARRRAEIESLAARDPERTADFLRGLMAEQPSLAAVPQLSVGEPAAVTASVPTTPIEAAR